MCPDEYCTSWRLLTSVSIDIFSLILSIKILKKYGDETIILTRSNGFIHTGQSNNLLSHFQIENKLILSILF